MMRNLILLSGMDGTGILFKPLLPYLENQCHCWIYDLNTNPDQRIDYQVPRIENQITARFGESAVEIVAESYSGLLAYQLLIRQQINIHKVYFIGGFLECPSLLAKFAPYFNLNLAKMLPNHLLGYLLFNQWQTVSLVTLFYEVLNELSKPDKQNMFQQRLKNIANAKPPSFEILTPCTYLQASHDKLVSKNNLKLFSKLCKDLTVVKLMGSHFLIQTNPKKVAEIILSHSNEVIK